METNKNLTIINNKNYFRIPFGNNDLILNKDELLKYRPKGQESVGSLKKLHNHYISYDAGLIGIRLQNGKSAISKVDIGVEIDALFISCECNLQNNSLCGHGYQVLLNFVKKCGGNFKPFYWRSFDNDESTVKKYLDVSLSEYELKIRPKREFNNLFLAGLGFKNEDAILFEGNRHQISVRSQNKQAIVGYQFFFSAPDTRWLFQIPILMPFYGLANEFTSDILTVESYITKENQSTISYDFTPNQSRLNAICFRMYELGCDIKILPEDSVYPKDREHGMRELLLLWKEAIPLIKKEPYLRSTYSFGLRRLESKPRIKSLDEFAIEIHSLEVSFLLKEHEDHYSLEPIIYASYIDVSEEYWKIPMFIIVREKFQYYRFHLVDNLQDDSLLQWFGQTNRQVTILKDEFEEFYKNFLSKLDDKYIIYFLGFKKRKTVQWNKRTVITPSFHQGLGDERKRQPRINPNL